MEIFSHWEKKRKIYDYNFLPLNQFISRYYTDFTKKKQWDSQWMQAIVLPAFQNDIQKLSIRLGVGISNIFSNKKMQEFYSKIKHLDFFDDDVKLFFSWMCGMSFFENQNKEFEEWINSRNYNTGGRHPIKDDLYSLKEMALEQNGNNLVRDKLMSLEWHKR